jgi:ferredoxin
MSDILRKFIAVLLVIWLPLFSGGAMSASVSMPMQNGSCHEAGMEAMQDMDEDQHAMSHDQSSAQDQHGTSCTACGVCHLACSGYLGVQAIKNMEVLQSAVSVTPYLFSFHSITSTPLVPPPLA